MNNKTESDSVVVSDRASRRRFIRVGAAFVAAGGALAGSHSVLAADCDQNTEQNTRCTDQDNGENGDPPGCGRCGRLVPTSLSGGVTSDKTRKIPRVKRIAI